MVFGLTDKFQYEKNPPDSGHWNCENDQFYSK